MAGMAGNRPVLYFCGRFGLASAHGHALPAQPENHRTIRHWHRVTRIHSDPEAVPSVLVAETIMKVSDILQIKGNTLYTVTPDTSLLLAVNTMAEHDIGSLVVMEYGDLVGMLTFREIIETLSRSGGTLGTVGIRKVMDDAPLTCTMETDVNEVRRMMLERHTRYLPVLDNRTLMGVISFYDVAKAVVEEQSFENKMLKAYIRDWPEERAD
jgi:CBS domain-containing protein